MKYGVIDKTGKEIVHCIYNEVKSFHDGLAIVSNGGYGYVDKNGKEVIPCMYEQANNFAEGLAFVRNGELVGFVNKEGKRALWKRVE